MGKGGGGLAGRIQHWGKTLLYAVAGLLGLFFGPVHTFFQKIFQNVPWKISVFVFTKKKMK